MSFGEIEALEMHISPPKKKRIPYVLQKQSSLGSPLSELQMPWGKGSCENSPVFERQALTAFSSGCRPDTKVEQTG